MKETTTEQMVSHLQFLGYEVTREGDKIRAKHPRQWNLSMRPLAGGVLCRSLFGHSDNAKCDRLGYLEQINSLNEQAMVARFYVDEDSYFCMEAWYPDYYDRIEFGAFVDTWNRDGDLLAKSEMNKYLE